MSGTPPFPQDQFIDDYLGLVDQTVAHYRPRLPASFLTEDLIGAGRLGLVIAAKTYKPSQGPADYWCKFCIRREILNLVAGRNWVWAKARQPLAAARNATTEPTEPQDERLTEAVTTAKLALTPAQRKLIDLMYEHSISLKQIGRSHLLTIPGVAVVGERTVRKLHKAAMEVLRAELERIGWAA